MAYVIAGGSQPPIPSAAAASAASAEQMPIVPAQDSVGEDWREQWLLGAGPDRPSTVEQIKFVKGLLTDLGESEEQITRTLAKVHTRRQASLLIDSLKARLRVRREAQAAKFRGSGVASAER